MSLFSAIGSLAGGLVGAGAQQGDKDRAEAALGDALNAQRYDTQVAGQTGTEFDKIDPVSRNAMLSALADYQNKAKMGGLDAVARANLEETQGRAQQTAAQTAHQIQSNAEARGAAQGPASMVAQQVAAQQGGQMARMGALQTGALAEQSRQAALQGGMGAAQNVYGMDANRAAAQDAINQFNVRNAQMNVANKRAQAEDIAGIDERKSGMFEGRSGQDVKNFAGIGKSAGAGVDAIAKSLMGGGMDMGAAGGFGTGSSALGEGAYQVDPTGGSGVI